MQLTKNIRVLDVNLDNTSPRMFDDVSGVLFWDDISNQAYYDIIKNMRELFWIPEEVSMAHDKLHWINKMSDEEKELYKDGIGVLASLDSVATYFDKIAADYIGDSAIKANMAFIAAMETIHNESYTYTISSLVSKDEAKEVFERPKKNEYIVKRNAMMMDIFDEFLEKRDLKSFAKSLVAMAALEGICFVNGFTPFYHFNREGKMFGTGTIIQFIQRDEVKHAYFQSILIRDIMTQYPELNVEEFSVFVYEFLSVLVNYEIEFCEHLYRNTPLIDIEEVKLYIGFRANLLLDNLGLDKIFAATKNPMEWVTAYDPENLNNTKSDFFEKEEINYSKSSEATNGWDDL